MPSDTDDIWQAIRTVRADQRTAQHQLEEACQDELQALTALDASRAKQDRCRRKVQACAESICTLQDALPRQRPGG